MIELVCGNGMGLVQLHRHTYTTNYGIQDERSSNDHRVNIVIETKGTIEGGMADSRALHGSFTEEPHTETTTKESIVE